MRISRSLLCVSLYTFSAITTAHAATVEQLISDTKYDQAAAVAENDNSHYLHKLITKANSLDLANHPKWHMLGHYKPDLLYGVTSEVDGPDFFLSKDGKTDPESELNATLASFFSNKPLSFDLTTQCRFVARFHWLKQELDFDPAQLPSQQCAKFEEFKVGIEAASLTIIFPSAHPDGPASMFGHTSLKVDKKSQTEATRMLDYTLNYAAMAGPERGFGYAVKGLIGGYEGRYSILPYYSKIREYAHLESRDIWEYKLAFTQEQVDFIIMHAYELSPTYFDYYFFTENCSYHLLSLVETGLEKPELTEQFSGWVIPIDTLKSLDNAGIIEDAAHLPSISTIIEFRRSQLSSDENRLTLALLKDGVESHEDVLASLPKARQAKILDLLFDYLRYSKIDDAKSLDTTTSQKEHEVLLKRSKLKIASEKLSIPKPEFRPDQGHETSRIHLEHIAGNDHSYQSVTWRAAYHELLDPYVGYSPNYHLEFFKLRFDSNTIDNQSRFAGLELLNIISLAPRDEIFKKISWYANLGWENGRYDGDFSSLFYFNGGAGHTYELNWFQHSYSYLLGGVGIEYGETLVGELNLAAEIKAGLLSHINRYWSVQLEGHSRQEVDPEGNALLNHTLSLDQSFAFTKDLSLRLGVSHHANELTAYNEGRVGLYFYY